MFIHTFLFVFLAEMADKTQLMIMALANKYRMKTIILGMIIGVVIISGFSVICGDFIGSLIPIWAVKLCGAFLFIFFGFHTLLKKDDSSNHHSKQYRFPILSIAFTFLLAELGDKTQLATVALAADHTTLQLQVFLGSALGLIMANIVGIFAGKFIFSHISDSTIRIGSAFIFLFFGSINIFEVFPYHPITIFGYSCILILSAYMLYQRTHRTSLFR